MSRTENHLDSQQSRGWLPRAADVWQLRGALPECVCALLLSILVLMIFVQVITRYVLAFPLTWSEEVVSFSFVWLCFLGAAVALKYRGHIIVSFLVDPFPAPVKKVIAALTGLAVVAFAALVAVAGYNMMVLTHAQISPALGAPMSFVYASLPVSSALMAYYELKHVWAAWTGQESAVSFFKVREEVNAK
jgi:TRAP-type C4-dicarboxylate transport system permease small subunit